MVLAQRIDTVRQFILAGHQVSVTYSYSTVAMKIKSKVMVSAAPNVVAESYRPLLLASIEPLLAMSSWCVTVDRGRPLLCKLLDATFASYLEQSGF